MGVGMFVLVVFILVYFIRNFTMGFYVPVTLTLTETKPNCSAMFNPGRVGGSGNLMVNL